MMAKKIISEVEKQLRLENRELHSRLKEAEEALNTMRNGESDAIADKGANSENIKSHPSSETPYRIILEEINECAVILQAVGTILYCNRRFADLASVTPEKAVGTNIRQFIIGNENYKFEELLKEGIKTCCCGEIQYSAPEGDVHFCHLSFRPMPVEILGDICLIITDITARKRAEQVLQESEIKYRELVENSPDAIVIYVDGEIVMVNNESLHLMRATSPDELIGKQVVQFVHPDSKEIVIERMKKMTKREAILPLVEEKFVRLDGSEIDVEVKAMSVKLDNLPAVQLIIRDISERKLAEELKKEIERVKTELLEKLNEAQHIASIGSWEWNLQTNTVWWSDETYQIFNVKETDFVPGFEENSKFIHPDDLELYRKSFEHCLQTDVPLDMDIRLIDNSGKLKYCQVQGVVVNDSSGQPVRFIGTLMDVTRRKVEQEQLHISEEERFKSSLYARSLIEASLDPLVTINVDGLIMDVNAATEKVTGLTRNNLVGTNFSDYFTEPEKARMGYQEVFDNGYVIDYPLTIQDALNRLTDVLYNASVYRDQNGRILGVFAAARDITDRKLAVQKLQKSEALLKEAQYIAQIGNWELNLETNELIWSDEIFHIFEINPALFGSNYDAFLNAIHPDDRDMVNRAYKNSLENHSPYEINHRLLLPDGRLKYVHESCETFYDTSGHPLRSVGIVQDITTRMQSENELHRNNTLLKLMGETAKVGGWEFDTETMRQHWTDEVYHIHELDSTFDPNVKKGLSFYAPSTRPVIELAVQRALEFGEPFDLELEFFTNKGNHRWVHSIGKAYQENGKTKKVYGSFQDITERKQTEEALRKSDIRLKLALETSHAGAWDLNLLDHTSERSLSHDQIFGYETLLPNWTYEMFLDHVLPEDRQEVDRKFREAVATYTEWSFDCRIRRIDGEVRWIFASGGHVLNSQGKYVLMSGLVQDITERKMVEEELKTKNEELLKVNTEKDKFFSIIAHDLRSPLGGFLGLTEIMAEGSVNISIEEFHKMAVVMRDSAKNIFHLLGNLLEWSRMQRGLTTYTPQLLLLNMTISECTDQIIKDAKNKGITIDFKMQEGLHVLADKNMLECIIRNLISNAVKFTPQGGKISVSARSDSDQEVEISIKDTGIGMNKDMIENLFRLDVNTNRKGTKGEYSTGLGLIICKDFIEKNGGKFWIESEEGKGSTFRFTLPGNQSHESK